MLLMAELNHWMKLLQAIALHWRASYFSNCFQEYAGRHYLDDAEWNMDRAIASEPDDVNRRLGELGLSVEDLHDALRRGQFARDNCTANHPRCYPNVAAWGELSSGLREILSFRGWTNCDRDNIPKTVAPDGSMAIIPITGDRATGNPRATPVTKRPRGLASVRLIHLNVQYDFLGDLDLGQEVEDEPEGRITWYLLYHRAGDQLRAELSLPMAVDGCGRIEAWRERIILPTIDLSDGPAPSRDADGGPDVDVPVQRRVG